MTDRGKRRGHRDLRPFFNPVSVAVVGASAEKEKWGNWIAERALRGAHRRQVYLVNRAGGTVLGQRTYPSLADLPEAPELVVVVVPAAAFESVVASALEIGTKAIIGISAGLGELGPEEAARQQAIAERVRDAGAMLLGPNSMGVVDVASDLYLSSNDFPPGRVGMISQSGNLALDVSEWAQRGGMGFRRIVMLGNQSDVEIADLLPALAAPGDLDAIAVYCEDFRDGRRLMAVASEVIREGCPIVLMAPGGSEASARAAASHTGALTSDKAVVRAACEAAGIWYAATPRVMANMLQAVRARAVPRGRRVAVLADGGGHSAISADQLSERGLEIPRLSRELAQAVAAELSPIATTINPIDLAGAGAQAPATFAATGRTVLESGEVDAVLMTGYFGGYEQYSETHARVEREAAEALCELPAATGRPLIVQTMYPNAGSSEILRRDQVPVYEAVEDAAAILALLADRATQTHFGIPGLLPPAPPVTSTGYWDARSLIASAGIEVPSGRIAGTPEDVREAAREIGFPVVLKAIDLLHKSDAGGVVLGIRDEMELESAYLDLAVGPGANVSVERMVEAAGIELLVGVRRDPRFGPVVLVGIGGIFAEILRDTVLALAPVDEAQAEGMLRWLRAAPILFGVRGRAPIDIKSASEAIARLSRLGAAHPELTDLEINPLLATSEGAIALDARMVRGT